MRLYKLKVKAGIIEFMVVINIFYINFENSAFIL